MKILYFLFVLVAVTSCSKFDSTKEKIEDDFSLYITDTSGVRNDGATSITIILTNSKEVKSGLQVSFETTKGTLLEEGLPYENNRAQTRLLLDSDTGIYSIKASVKDGSAVKIIKVINFSFRKAYEPGEFILSANNISTVRANGTTLVSVALSSAVKSLDGLRVLFETNKGELIQGDQPFTGGLATTQLRVSQDTGIYVVKASLKDGPNVKILKVIQFSILPASPDTIILELSKVSWNLTSTIMIKTLLSRIEGKVTTGYRANFRAYQSAGTGYVDVGNFQGLLNNVTTANGQLTDITLATNTPGIDTTKTLFVEANSHNDQRQVIKTIVQLPYIR